MKACFESKLLIYGVEIENRLKAAIKLKTFGVYIPVFI